MNQNEPSIFPLVNGYTRQAWNIFATSIVITLLAATFVLSQTPIYRATATIPTRSSSDPTELLSIQSADFLRTIVENNDIDFKSHSGLEAYVVKGFGFTSSQKSVGKMTDEMQVAELQTNLHLAIVENSKLIDIHFESPDPKLAASLANLIAETYLTTASVSGNVAQTNALPDKIDKAESELLAFLQGNPGAVSALARLDLIEADLKTWEDKLSALDVSIRNERSVLKHLKNTSDLSQAGYDRVFTRDSGISLVLKKSAGLKAERQKLSSRYGSHHLKIMALTKEIEEIDLKLELQIDRSIQGMENEIKANKIKREAANDRITDIKKTTAELQAQQLKHVTLQLAIESAKRHLDSPGKTNGPEPSFAVAAVPANPIRPRVREPLLIIFTLSLAAMTTLMLIRTKLSQ